MNDAKQRAVCLAQSVYSGQWKERQRQARANTRDDFQAFERFNPTWDCWQSERVTTLREDLAQNALAELWERFKERAEKTAESLPADDLEAFEHLERMLDRLARRLRYPRHYPAREESQETPAYWPFYLAFIHDLDPWLIDALVADLSERDIATAKGISRHKASELKAETVLRVAAIGE